MQECQKCLALETKAGIKFNSEGVCNVCTQQEVLVDWEDRKRMLENLANQHRGSGEYDCIVPLSGGKDSTYTVYYLVKELGLKCLVVSYDHGFFRTNLLKNRQRMLNRLNCDFVTYKSSPKTSKAISKAGLIFRNDFCLPCHLGVFVYPVKEAIRRGIKLIVWGEGDGYWSPEGHAIEEVDENYFKKINLNTTIDEIQEWTGLSTKDLLQFNYPSQQEFQEAQIKSIHLGNYIKWDPKKHSEIINKELGWEFSKVEGIPEQYGYEKVECAFQGVRDYIIRMTKGFGRTRHLMSIDLRQGRLKKEDAKYYIEMMDNFKPASLQIFLEYLNMTELEFNSILERHTKLNKLPVLKEGKKVPDHDKWLINI